MPTQLPAVDVPFRGTIGETAAESSAARPQIDLPSATAPNVVIVLLDDVGFGASSTFGGPIEMPTLAALAHEGLRYNQFHTTALCSPTRAALLTGRNHHQAHMGAICEIAVGFPGYDSIIPRSTATIGEIARQNGYSTAWYGKGHVTPMWETSAAGPFDRWPTGLGFERFYGFLGGEASQWEPALYDQTTPIEAHVGKDHYHLTEDLADQCISWMQAQKSAAPTKPFLIYFAPGAGHSPHHVWKEYADRYKGRFDGGWDALREETFQRQIETGTIPAGTQLTPRPEQVPAWEDYPERYRPVAARLMEVYAGFLSHTDEQIGRIVDGIKELGEWEKTLFIYIVGDNGASGEGTIHGAWSAPSFQNGMPEDPELLLQHIEDMGTPHAENHYNVGWAWALDAPFQWMKQVASHFGGTRNGVVMTLPSRIKEGGGLRGQFHHIIDIAPTILELAGIEAPSHVNGIEQSPFEGVSMVYTFDQPDAPSTHTTQYFEILGNRAIYQDGWIASCFHGRVPWIRSQAMPFGAEERWELYRISDDFSQSQDLAEEFPEKLQELRTLFDVEAHRNQVYPLSDDTTARADPRLRPSLIEGQRDFVYHGAMKRQPELSSVNLKNTSFTLSAEVSVPATGAEGVLVAQGGNMAGWSLYLKDGEVVYFYNYFGRELSKIAGAAHLVEGRNTIHLTFDYDGGGMGKGGTVTLTVNDTVVAEGRVERTVPFLFSMSGETLDVGVDSLAPVGPYPHEFPFTGTIHRVAINLAPPPSQEHVAAESAGREEAAKRAQ